MTLYELFKENHNDYDTYDKDFDACITCCSISDDDIDTKEYDAYGNFVIELYKKVNITRIILGSHIVCDWSRLIQNNMDKFKTFTLENWNNQYENDEDEFIYQWIKEINLYLAGYVSEDFYTKLVKFVKSLEI